MNEIKAWLKNNITDLENEYKRNMESMDYDMANLTSTRIDTLYACLYEIINLEFVYYKNKEETNGIYS